VFGSKTTTLNSEEGPAFGVAILAAVGGGDYSNVVEACDETIRQVSELAPNPDAQKKYDAAFAVYQRLYRSLKADFEAISTLGGRADVRPSNFRRRVRAQSSRRRFLVSCVADDAARKKRRSPRGKRRFLSF
jgi:hypothetical protein